MRHNRQNKAEPNTEKYRIDSLTDITWSNLKNVIRYNHYAQMLLILLIMGGILRFYNLGYNSLWLDEACTYDFAKLSLGGILELTTKTGDVNPPLFYAIEHFMLVLGNSEVILRFIPALLGVFSIPVMYFLGREICGRLAGIIAAALLTFSTFHVYYSQDARAYTTVLFFFSLAVLFYLLALKRNSIPYWCLFGIFCALAFWSHFYVFIGIGIIFLHAFIIKRNEIFKNIASIKPIIIGLLSFVLLTSPLLYGTIQLYFMRTASAPTWGISGFDVLTQTIVLFSGSQPYLTVLFLIAASIGIGYLMFGKDKRSFALLLAMLIILPFIASVFFSSIMPMSPRYLIFVLPFYFTAIGAAFNFLPKDIDAKKIAVIAIILIGLVSIPYFTSYYTTYSKNDWRGFSEYLTAETQDGDYVVVMPGYMTLPLNYYYDSTTDATREVQASSAKELREIEQKRENTTAYYVVTADIYAANPEGDALNWLNANTKYMGRNMGINLFISQ